MTKLEKLVQKFDDRMKDITEGYAKFVEERDKVNLEFLSIKDDPKHNNIDVSRLFGKKETVRPSRYDELKEELQTMNKYIADVQRLGGIGAICKTDEELEKIAHEIEKETHKKLEEDTKKRDALNATYRKIESDLEAANKDRKTHAEEREKVKEIIRKVRTNTSLEFRAPFNAPYNFEKRTMRLIEDPPAYVGYSRNELME